MKQRPRIYYTEEQKSLMWDRWQKGESLHQIAQLFDRHHASVQRILAKSGGIRPAPRRRSSRSLTLADREEISRGLASDRSLRAIALNSMETQWELKNSRTQWGQTRLIVTMNSMGSDSIDLVWQRVSPHMAQ